MRNNPVRQLFTDAHLVILLLLIMGWSGCQECDDCGPSQREPCVRVKFFNIDSLIKTETRISFLQDSLAVINELILNGDTTLLDTRNELEGEIDQLGEVIETINEGRIRIGEVFGGDGQGPLLFRDSVNNDSLTVFKFPLDMNRDESVFNIHINDRVDELGLRYRRENIESGDLILLEVSGLELISTTYDSVKIRCNGAECISNETDINIYF